MPKRKMKILYVIGARPQFIKLAPLSKRLKQKYHEVFVHTGQHFDKEMSDLFFQELEISKPDYNLRISGGSHGEQTGRMLIEMEKNVLVEKPDLIIVFGDTNSTLAGALIASKLHIPSIHIEAGLRSFNTTMPEEINRIVSDHICDYLFVPTNNAMNHLKNENLNKKSFLTGDIMVESIKLAISKTKQNDIVRKLNLKPNNFHLLTLHRPYNVDFPEKLTHILNELGKLNAKIVFPIHPRTKKIVEQNQIKFPSNIMTLKPLGYLDFVTLESNCHKIITDSGGIQKEAYILKKPCITLRSETEWIETVDEGWNLLVDIDKNSFYYNLIEKFEPSEKYNDFLGINVVENMVYCIDKLFL